MIKHFKYTKENGEVSERFVFPISINDDKIFAVDLTKYSKEEREEYDKLLTIFRVEYINDIKEAGFNNDFRNFFIKGMADV